MPGALGPDALTTNFIGRIVSSACSSSGSAIWASAKNIKPLVDANCHMEAIEIEYHQSPIRFSPIHYRNPESKSRSPSGQTILFGCPLELCGVGAQKKIPPVLEYLLDSVDDWPTHHFFPFEVGQGTEIVQLTHYIVRWRSTGLWRISLNKHGQVWRNPIALPFQSSPCKTTTGCSLWFVCSDAPHRKLKTL